MTNVAAASLAALTQLGGQQAEVAGSGDALARTQSMVEDANQGTSATTKVDGGSGVGEAVAAGLAASFILGPIGGLIMGATTGFLKRRSEQNVLDTLADRENAITASYDTMRAGFEADLSDDMSQLDREQVAGNLASLEAGYQMMLDPNTQQAGAQIYAQSVMAQERWRTQNEVQAINLERERVQDEIAFGKETRATHERLLGNFEAASATFDSQQRAIAEMRSALNKGDSAGALQVFSQLPLLINPQAGAVTDSELEMWNGLGNRLNKLQQIIDTELGTGGLTDDTRREMLGLLDRFDESSFMSQRALEQRTGREVVLAGLPEKYWPSYNRTGNVPRYQVGEFMSNADVATPKNEIIDQAKQVTDPDFWNYMQKSALGTAEQVKINFLDWYSGSGREQRQQRMLETN